MAKRQRGADVSSASRWRRSRRMAEIVFVKQGEAQQEDFRKRKYSAVLDKN